MGIDADSRLSGNYYLQTNGETAFDRGKHGMIYESP